MILWYNSWIQLFFWSEFASKCEQNSLYIFEKLVHLLYFSISARKSRWTTNLSRIWAEFWTEKQLKWPKIQPASVMAKKNIIRGIIFEKIVKNMETIRIINFISYFLATWSKHITHTINTYITISIKRIT